VTTVDRATVELMSRPIPYSRTEIAWARRRPAELRTPIPAEGDTVLCRLVEWEEPYEATVERVQPSDDVNDPHLFEVALDHTAEPVLIEGLPVMNGLDDPWPTLWLVVATPGGRIVHTHTREARLRGSAGWLPPDWKTRRRWLPTQLEGLVSVDG
jgi:hypothetical protein